MEIPFVGPSYQLDSRPSGVQRTVNLIPHPQEPGNERTAWVFQDVPGLVLVTDFPVAPTDTVLFLFHMTETATAEGLAEFTGTTTATDQTGRTWSEDNPGWALDATDPSPKFGAFSASADNGASPSWFSDGFTPVPFATVNTGFAIEFWYYLSDAGFSVGGQMRAGFESSGEVVNLLVHQSGHSFQYPGGSISLSAYPAQNQWVHLRGNYDGSTMRLFIDGQLEGEESVMPPFTSDINYLSFGLTADIGETARMDELYSVIGSSLGTSNFTPPSSPWPNP